MADVDVIYKNPGDPLTNSYTGKRVLTPTEYYFEQQAAARAQQRKIENLDSTYAVVDSASPDNAIVNTGLSGGKKKVSAPAPIPLPTIASKPITSSVTNAQAPGSLSANMPKSLSVSPAQQAGNEASETAFNDLMKQMSTVAGSQLKGEIPADVEAQVRMQAAEKGLFNGLGANGPANRALTARDLGLTSMQIQQQGQQAGQALAGLAESRRQFNVSSEQTYKSYLEDVRRGDLTAADLSERSRQYNTSQRLAATEMMVNILDSYNKLSYSYSAITHPTAGQLASQQSSADSYEAAIKQIKTDYGIGV